MSGQVQNHDFLSMAQPKIGKLLEIANRTRQYIGSNNDFDLIIFLSQPDQVFDQI